MKKKTLLTGTFALMLVFAMFLTGCGLIDDLIPKEQPEKSEPVPEPPKSPDKVMLNSSSLTLVVGDTKTLKATVLPSEATNQSVKWISADSEMVEVNANGTVSAISEGETLIIVTTVDGDKTAKCAVSVIKPSPNVPDPTGVSLFPPTLTIDIGEKQTLTAAVTPTGAVTGINWSSEKPAVVVVEDGIITAIGEGEAKVYAQTVVGGLLAFSQITVTAPLIDDDPIPSPIDRIELPKTVKTVLGYGYDITSRYAYSPYIKSAVLDLDKLLYDQQVKEDPNLKYGEFETVTGNDINEYTRNITAKVSYSANASLEKVVSFSNEVGANFSEERTKKGEYAFTTSTSRIVTGAYHIKDQSKLYAFFTQDFKDDLGTMNPDQLIKKYGTHVMLGAVLGARVDYHLSVRKKAENNITNLGAYAKTKAEATYKDVTAGAGDSADADTKFTQYFYTETTDPKTRVFGGKVQYGQYIHNKLDYDKWLESIEGNEIWIDYYPNSLVPISDLVTDETRSTALAEAINIYCEGKVIPVAPFQEIGPLVFYDERRDAKWVKDGESWNINSSFNLSGLKSAGYSKLRITLQYDAALIDSSLKGCYLNGEIMERGGKVYKGRTDSNQKYLSQNTYKLSEDVLLDEFSNSLTARWTIQKACTYRIQDRKITIEAVN